MLKAGSPSLLLTRKLTFRINLCRGHVAITRTKMTSVYTALRSGVQTQRAARGQESCWHRALIKTRGEFLQCAVGYPEARHPSGPIAGTSAALLEPRCRFSKGHPLYTVPSTETRLQTGLLKGPERPAKVMVTRFAPLASPDNVSNNLTAEKIRCNRYRKLRHSGDHK